MDWRGGKLKLLFLICFFDKGLTGRVPGGGGTQRRLWGRTKKGSVSNLASATEHVSSSDLSPKSTTSNPDVLFSRPNAIPQESATHKRESNETVKIGVQVVKVPNLKFHEKVRIYQDVWDKIIKRQSTSNPSQQENRKDVSLQNVNWKPKKTGRHIKQARNRNREKTGNGFLLDFHKINKGEYEKYKKENTEKRTEGVKEPARDVEENAKLDEEENEEWKSGEIGNDDAAPRSRILDDGSPAGVRVDGNQLENRVGEIATLNHPDIFSASTRTGGERGDDEKSHYVKVAPESEGLNVMQHPDIFSGSENNNLVEQPPLEKVGEEVQLVDYPSIYNLAGKSKTTAADEREKSFGIFGALDLEHPSIFLQSVDKSGSGKKSADIAAVVHPSIYTLSKVLEKGKMASGKKETHSYRKLLRKGSFREKLKRLKEKSDAFRAKEPVQEQESLQLLTSGYPAPVDESQLRNSSSSSEWKDPPRTDVWFSLKPAPALPPTSPPKESLQKTKKPSSKDLAPSMRMEEDANLGNNATAAHILPWFASNPHPDLPPPRLKPSPQSVEYSPHHKAFVKTAKKTKQTSGNPKRLNKGKTRLRPHLQHSAPALTSPPDNENLELLTLTLTPDDSDDVKEVSEKQLQIGGGAATPQVIQLRLDATPLLLPFIPTVFGLGAGLGFLASSFGFSQSIAGIASPDTNVDVTITNNNSPTITATVQGTASATNTNNDNDQNTASSTNTNTNTNNGRNFNQGLQFGRALSESLQGKAEAKRKVRKRKKSGSILLQTLVSSLNLLKTSVPLAQ